MTIAQRLHHRFRVVLKHTLNPLTRALARRGWGPFALIRHVGRKSGSAYETPILLGLTPAGFVAELTYGPNVDWVKNVQAAGGCVAVWRGRPFTIDRIAPLDAKTGRASFPAPARGLLKLMRRNHYLLLTGPQTDTAGRTTTGSST